MPDSAVLAVVLAGLLGGTHCFGMCGGIVAAMSGSLAGGSARWPLHLGYNAGRIVSYSAFGAVAGAAGSVLILAESVAPRLVLLVIASFMMIAMGAYLIGLPQLILPLEKAGRQIWRHVQPLAARLLPVRSAAQAFSLGLVWGWLPCGLVYGALASALASGSAIRGAMTMLAFGLGTLPNLLLAGFFADRVRLLLQSGWVRRAAGLCIVGLGLYGLLGVWRIGHAVH